MNKKHLILTSCLILVFGLTGCIKNPKKPSEVIEPVVSQTEESPQGEEEEPEIRGTEFEIIPELKSISFGYERYEVTQEASESLQQNASYLKAHPELEVLIEGNCCECGTNDYNMALGQKRAQTVRDYYINLGVASGKIGTISFGEEKPEKPNVGPPDSPGCTYNRYAVTKVRQKAK
ncbi:MAG: hypothetical protein A2252_07890 [Elusimicrobia bacterium RIFOXYA2_FULL_39_19]|nr:MAG: hypothetical protein A2252_07890 [Elusimicrobia bacterium RIFOXYA2_FULL_39_19]